MIDVMRCPLRFVRIGIGWYVLCNVCCFLSGVCWLVAMCCLMFAVCCLMFVVCWLLVMVPRGLASGVLVCIDYCVLLAVCCV